MAYAKEIEEEMNRISSVAGISMEQVKKNVDSKVKEGASPELAIEKYKATIAYKLNGEMIEGLALVVGKEMPRVFSNERGEYTSAGLHLFIQKSDGFTLRSMRLYGDRAPMVDNYTIGELVKGKFKLLDNGTGANLITTLEKATGSFPTILELVDSLPADHANKKVALKDVAEYAGKGRYFFQGVCSGGIMSRADPGKKIGFMLSSLSSNPVTTWISNINMEVKDGPITVFGRPYVSTKTGKLQIDALGVFQ